MKDFFKADLVYSLFEKIQIWLITELPIILLLTLALVIVLRLVRFSIKRLSGSLRKLAEKKDKENVNESEKRINTLTGILQGSIKIILVSIYIMIILQKVGVNILPIVTSAGIIGLAVGFGAQELVRDVISGFFILLENQVRTGDVAIINGTGGLVEKIELRTITLRDFSGVVHIFQNGKINGLSNMTKDWSAMVFDIGVAYKEDLQVVMNVMKETGDALRADAQFAAKILEPIEIFGLDSFGDSALVIKARLKTKPIEQWAIGREYRKRLKAAFDLHNIEIPFPHTTIYWGEKISTLQLQVNESPEKT